MKKYIYLFNILLMSVALGFSACSDDDDDNGQGNEGPTGGCLLYTSDAADD